MTTRLFIFLYTVRRKVLKIKFPDDNTVPGYSITGSTVFLSEIDIQTHFWYPSWGTFAFALHGMGTGRTVLLAWRGP